jgi:hypothetical protein
MTQIDRAGCRRTDQERGEPADTNRAAQSALIVVVSNELAERALCTRENVEAAYEQGLPVDLGG